MTTPEPPVAQRDFAVLIQGAALPLLYRAVLTLAARHHRDGLASPPLLHEIRTALYRVMSAPGREIASAAPTKPCCDMPERERPDQYHRSGHALVDLSSAGDAASRPG